MRPARGGSEIQNPMFSKMKLISQSSKTFILLYKKRGAERNDMTSGLVQDEAV